MKWRNVRLYLAAFATYAIVRLIQVWTLLISCDSVSMDFITTFNAIDFVTFCSLDCSFGVRAVQLMTTFLPHFPYPPVVPYKFTTPCMTLECAKTANP